MQRQNILQTHLLVVKGAQTKNASGLIKQHIPKWRPLSNVTQEEIKMNLNQLNNGERKRLGFKIINEVFMQPAKRFRLRT